MIHYAQKFFVNGVEVPLSDIPAESLGFFRESIDDEIKRRREVQNENIDKR